MQMGKWREAGTDVTPMDWWELVLCIQSAGLVASPRARPLGNQAESQEASLFFILYIYTKPSSFCLLNPFQNPPPLYIPCLA